MLAILPLLAAVFAAAPSAGSERVRPPRLSKPKLSEAVAKKFKVDCELCSDGSVSLERGIRITLHKDQVVAFHGLGLAESSARLPLALDAFRPGTAHNIFRFTGVLRESLTEASRWSRFMGALELRLSNVYVNPRVTLAIVRYEAAFDRGNRGPHPASGVEISEFAFRVSGPHSLARTAFVIVPGIDTNFFGRWRMHGEAIIAYPVRGPAFGVYASISANF